MALSHEDHYRGWVLGFLFSEDLERVVLIKKNRPAFAANKLNGVGGKIEPGESHRSAMEREFKEETGVNHSKWLYIGHLEVGEKYVHIFGGTGNVDKCMTTTDEKVVIMNTVKVMAQPQESVVYGVPSMVQTASVILKGQS